MKLSDSALKEILLNQLSEEVKAEKAPEPATFSVRRQVQQDDEATRRFCLDLAFRVMGDDKNNVGMNYTMKDLVIAAEQVRAYVEGGAFMSEPTAWDGLPKVEPDEYQTIGAE